MGKRAWLLGAVLVACGGWAAFHALGSTPRNQVPATPVQPPAGHVPSSSSAARSARLSELPSSLRAADVSGDGRSRAEVASVEESDDDVLRVRVVALNGSDAANLVVTAGWRALPGEHLRGFLGEARSDVAGRCRLSTAPCAGVGDYLLHVSCEAPSGFIAGSWRGPPPGEELVLELVRGAWLRGRVLLDGLPVEGEDASLDLRWQLEPDRTGSSACAVEDGRYSTGPELAGELVRAVLTRSSGRPLGLRCEGAPLTAGEEREWDLAFESGFDLELQVLAADTGQPIAGVTAFAAFRGMARTDAAGIYRAPAVFGPGGSVLVFLSHDDYVSQDVRSFCPAGGGDVFEVVRLQSGQSLAGTLLGVNGQTLSRASVECRQACGPRTRAKALGGVESRTVRTDELGHFELRGLPDAEQYDLLFRMGSQLLSKQLATLGEERTYVVDAPLTLRGVVLEADGSPSKKRQVIASLSHGDVVLSRLCADTGEFTFSGLCPGDWFISCDYGNASFLNPQSSAVQAEVGRWVQVQPPGVQALELRLPAVGDLLERSRVVRISARDRRSRYALEEFKSLQIRGLGNSLSVQIPPGSLGPAGLPYALYPGDYEIQLAAEGYATSLRVVSVEPGAETLPIEFELDPRR